MIFKVHEAKNLLSSDGSANVDPFCLLVVDDEVVARTVTKWKDANPYFGEEFHLNVSNDFQHMAIVVCNSEREEQLGRVVFSAAALAEQQETLDQWFPLTKLTRDFEVMGEVEVEVLMSGKGSAQEQLTVTVIRARDLAPKELSMKFEAVAVVEMDAEKLQTDRSAKSRAPSWSAQHLVFQRPKLASTIKVTIRDGSGIGSSFIGECVVSLDGLSNDIPRRKWHRLMPRERDQSVDPSPASIRLKFKLLKEMVLDMASYQPLISFVLKDLEVPDMLQTGCVGIIEDIVTSRDSTNAPDRDEVARILMRVLLNSHQALELLRKLNGLEISKCTNTATLFRGNSMATKCTDQFMKIVGLRYLIDTLKPIIDKVFLENKECEIDPTKITAKNRSVDELIVQRAAILSEYLDELFRTIFASSSSCPYRMRVMFKDLRLLVTAHEASLGSGDVLYTVVSGFVFLRFFAPAVLAPNLFGLRNELADVRVSRTLTLLAKALQSVGNLGSAGKESFMAVLNPLLVRNADVVKKFIDSLCDVEDGIEAEMVDVLEETSSIPREHVQLESSFYCREDNLSSSFKKADFALSNYSLKFTRMHETAVIIPLRSITLVEHLEPVAFDKKHVIQVFSSSIPTLYIQFLSSSESHAWVQLLRVGCSERGGAQAKECHAGIFKGGKWTCCRSTVEREPDFCSKTHITSAINRFLDNPSPEECAQSLFNLFLTAKSKLEQQYVVSQQEGTSNPKVATARALLHVVDDIHIAQLLHQDVL